jgi:hypothetical protein
MSRAEAYTLAGAVQQRISRIVTSGGTSFVNSATSGRTAP